MPMRILVSVAAFLISFGFSIDAVAQQNDLETPQQGLRSQRALKTTSTLNSSRLLLAQSKLAPRLLSAVAKKRAAGENIMISPASLGMALAVVDLGADTALKASIRTALALESRIENDRKPARDDLDLLRKLVTKLETDRALSNIFIAANAIYIDPMSQPTMRTLDKVAQSGAVVFREPLGDGTLARINGWVSSKTKGLIPSILERSPAEAELIALNAVYFKDKWRVQFDEGKTQQMPFHRLDGSSHNVPMMLTTIDKVSLRTDQSFVAVDLQYTHRRFSLMLVTTLETPRPASAFEAIGGWLGGDGFNEREAEVLLPRFELIDSVDMLEPLEGLGLQSGLASPTSLKGFSNKPISVTQIVQKTILQVDEAGTTAAAATAATFSRSMADGGAASIVFDKPFVFALLDHATGAILLYGYVGDPKQGRTE
ncbi:serine protease inhibitor [Bradyrhizobium japonicum]